MNISQLEKGGFPALHAQRDLRTAPHDHRLYPRPDQPRRHRRYPFRRTRPPRQVSQGRTHHHRRVRHVVARRPDRGAPDRRVMPHSRRSGIRLGVPLPQSGHTPQRHRNYPVAVRRNRRHTGRCRIGPQQRRIHIRYLQRHRFIDRPGDGFRLLHPRRSRNRRGFDQSLYGPGNRPDHARAECRQTEKKAFRRNYIPPCCTTCNKYRS